MIEKTIKVGSGTGPMIATSRYKNVSLVVSGLGDGELFVSASPNDKYIQNDCTVHLGDVSSVQVTARTKSCVIVKLRAEAM